MGKPGRPKAKNPKDDFIKIRLTKNMKEITIRTAERCGYKNVSEYVRDLIIGSYYDMLNQTRDNS